MSIGEIDRPVIASRLCTVPDARAGVRSIAGTSHSNALVNPPPESLKGEASAKSQVIASACRANAFRTDAVRAEPPVELFVPLGPLSQVARVLFRSVNLLTANPRYVATASAYACAPTP